MERISVKKTKFYLYIYIIFIFSILKDLITFLQILILIFFFNFEVD